MARRPTDVKPIVCALAALPLMVGCSSAQTPRATPGPSGTSLSQDDVVRAETVAYQAIADIRGVSVSSATAVERSGRVEVKDSNTGHPCTSGHELEIKLVGKFPHEVTSGHPVQPGSPTPDFRVRAIILTADAESGLVCLNSVQDGEDGEPQPLTGGTRLSVNQSLPGGRRKAPPERTLTPRSVGTRTLEEVTPERTVRRSVEGFQSS
jgi:hypothetical protein